MDNSRELADLIDTEKLQKLQDNFAKALNLAFITVDYRGRPIIEYSGFTEFCNKIREREECRKLCYQCDAHGGLHATITGEPYIYRCHTGLVDFAVPLILDGKYMGSVMGGQVKLEEPVPELEPILPQTTHWQDDPELADAASRVHRIRYEQMVAGVYLLRDMIQSLLEEEYQKVTQAELRRKSQELLEEKAARISLEEALEEGAFSMLVDYLGSEFLFYILNVIARLAYREKAEETEKAVCDFASMMRYLTENKNNSFVTVGEELEYIDYYLQIQKRRLEGRLAYEIKVPEECKGILCPFLLLQPLVENSLKYAVEPSREGGMLAIRGKAEGGAFVLTISDSGTGMSREQISTILELEERHRGSGKSKNYLTNINRKIKGLFGESYGVFIRSKEDGFPGTEVQIRLPQTNDSTIM